MNALINKINKANKIEDVLNVLNFKMEFNNIVKTYRGLYADISVLNNPGIIPRKEFAAAMKEWVNAGLEDRLLFGSDNADIKTTVVAVEDLDFLSNEQKQKIFYSNAKRLFAL